GGGQESSQPQQQQHRQQRSQQQQESQLPLQPETPQKSQTQQEKQQQQPEKKEQKQQQQLTISRQSPNSRSSQCPTSANSKNPNIQDQIELLQKQLQLLYQQQASNDKPTPGKEWTTVEPKKRPRESPETRKKPLSMFIVELKANPNNKEIYDIKYLFTTKIVFEPPRPKREIPQCANCQQYGHTKAYCRRRPVCIKCAGPHLSADCSRKTKSNDVKCAL
ncbi:putative uncharacterized protein DDB_G0271606, partial [Rhagoletis pomonella]|uniref:putative uncharacterized protein DDB_G0271606 n=1 Tax=Rhagoletis pomonella TaxID=28610 RepID=UPI001783EBBC